MTIKNIIIAQKVWGGTPLSWLEQRCKCTHNLVAHAKT